LLSWRRLVEEVVVMAVDTDPLLPRTLQPTGSIGIVERCLRHDPVQLEDELRRQDLP
jgi:hypothetical protein